MLTQCLYCMCFFKIHPFPPFILPTRIFFDSLKHNKNSVFFYCACKRSRGILPLKTSLEQLNEWLTLTVWGSSGREKGSVRNRLNREQRAHGPRSLWLSIYTWSLSLLRGCLSYSLWIRPECGELNWCECLYRGTDDSRGGNANDLYGQ